MLPVLAASRAPARLPSPALSRACASVTLLSDISSVLMCMDGTPTSLCELAGRSGGTRTLQIPSTSQGISLRQRLMLWRPPYSRMMNFSS